MSKLIMLVPYDEDQPLTCPYCGSRLWFEREETIDLHVHEYWSCLRKPCYAQHGDLPVYFETEFEFNEREGGVE